MFSKYILFLFQVLIGLISPEMESMMVMEAENSMNPRRSFSTMGSNYLCGGGGGGFHQFNNYSRNQNFLPFTSFSSISQLFSNAELFSDAGMSNYGSYQPPLYSTMSVLPHQPPLLPLPISAYGNTLSTPTKKTVVATVRSKNSMKKKKKKATTKQSCIRQTKEIQGKKLATAAAVVVVSKEEEETGEEFLLSPPPSSLPLPKLLLTARPKAESCSDDLRRLLRL